MSDIPRGLQSVEEIFQFLKNQGLSDEIARAQATNIFNRRAAQSPVAAPTAAELFNPTGEETVTIEDIGGTRDFARAPQDANPGDMVSNGNTLEKVVEVRTPDGEINRILVPTDRTPRTSQELEPGFIKRAKQRTKLLDLETERQKGGGKVMSLLREIAEPATGLTGEPIF